MPSTPHPVIASELPHDRDEVKIAKQAQSKTISDETMKYAQVMERDHGTNLTQTEAFAKGKGGQDNATADADSDRGAPGNREVAAA